MENLTRLPEKRSVALLVLLTIVTLGIYPFIWYYRRSTELNNLGTEKKLGKIWITILLVLAVAVDSISVWINYKQSSFITTILEGNISSLGTVSPIVGTLLILQYILLVLSIALIIIALFVAFRSRTIINQALEKKGVTRKISWFFTLIFNFYYLQYEINRTLENLEMEKRIGPWIALVILVLVPLLAVLLILILFVTLMNSLLV